MIDCPKREVSEAGAILPKIIEEEEEEIVRDEGSKIVVPYFLLDWNQG